MRIKPFLDRIVRHGALEVTLPGGRRLTVGDGSEANLAVWIADNATLARIMAKPSLGAGEAYMAGRLVVERGSIHDLIELISQNTLKWPDTKRPSPMRRWWDKQLRERNERNAARRNVARHYDLSIDLYRRFLDKDLQYSCAYFDTPRASLDDAQAAKKRHIAAKLLLGPGQRVLDIGCGWGGLALALAEQADVHVEGVTLSSEQLTTARQRAHAAGVDDRVGFSLTDYRDIAGPYDRIVSIGMFEHVGRPNYGAFFDQVARLLTDDGVALIHSIGRAEGPSTTDPFTAKYIFPGGYVPALSEVLPAVERAGLRVTDIEILRLHYAETLRCWRERFAANRAEIAALYDERFCRMWEFYLSGAEMGFRYGGHMVFQLQLTKRVDAVPLTRDYITQRERAGAAKTRRVA